jgi:hypothetical protein
MHDNARKSTPPFSRPARCAPITIWSTTIETTHLLSTRAPVFATGYTDAFVNAEFAFER